MMRVDVRLISRSPLSAAAIRRIVRLGVQHVQALSPLRELSVVTVGPRRMAHVNARFRGQLRPTNVLAFSYPAPFGGSRESRTGEIFLCPSVLRREAARRALPVRPYMAYLLFHGLLHCAGHDHRSRATTVSMERLENRLLRALPHSLRQGIIRNA